MKRKCLCALVLLLIVLFPYGVALAEDAQLLTVGTGSVNGVFYPVGQGICKQVNKGRMEHGIRCRAYSTGAAVYNLNALNTGELDLGITYASLAIDAYEGKGVFSEVGANPELRAVMELYPMVAGVIVNNDLDIDNFWQIGGHRINIGNIGSGKRAVADALLKAGGLTLDDFSAATEWSTAQVEEAFCGGEVDVIVEAMAADAPFFKKITRECDGRFLPVPKEILNQVSPSLGNTVMPGQKFLHNPDPFSLVQINAVLVSHNQTSAQAIEAALGSLLDDIETIGQLHSVFNIGDSLRLLKQADFIPRHTGATNYLRAVTKNAN